MMIKIEQAMISDVTKINELAMKSKAHWGYSEEFLSVVKEELTYSANDVSQNPTYTAKLDDQLVGFYQLVKLDQDQVELEALFLHPNYIGSGFGTSLFNHAQKKAIALKFKKILVHSDPFAENFYLRMGCIKIGEKPSLSIPNRVLPLLSLNL